MSLSLLNFLGNSTSSPSSSLQGNERLGLGTTGLGPQCNKTLFKDSDHSIKDYLVRKDKEMQQRAREDASKGGKPLKRQDQQAQMRQLQEKFAAQKEAERAHHIQERQAAEARLKAERQRILMEARDAVEQAKVENRRQRELRNRQRMESEERRRQKIQEDVAFEREMLRLAEENQKDEFNEYMRHMREAQREAAEKEKEAKRQQELLSISKEKKKLERLREESRTLRQSTLLSKRDEIRMSRTEKEKKEQREKEQHEKEREKEAELKAQEKMQLQMQKQERLQALLAEKQNVVQKVKSETVAARRQLITQREEWEEMLRSGAEYPGKPPTSPMFPQLRSPYT